METEILLTVDFAFKLTVGNPEHPAITLHFVNAVLSDEQPIREITFLNPTVERDSRSGKLLQLDIRLRDVRGRHLNIEMQTSMPGELAKRLTYHAARLFAEQIKRGDEYRQLRPAVGIWLLDRAMPQRSQKLHLEFGLRTAEGEVLGDNLAIHLLQLPFQTVDEHNVVNASKLEQWAFFLRNAHRYSRQRMSTMLPDPVFQEAMGVLEMISRDTKRRMDYEWRLKEDLDQNYFRSYYLDEGQAIGLRTGRVVGELIGKITVLEQVLRIPATPTDELQSWSVERLTARADELADQLSRQGS